MCGVRSVPGRRRYCPGATSWVGAKDLAYAGLGEGGLERYVPRGTIDERLRRWTQKRDLSSASRQSVRRVPGPPVSQFLGSHYLLFTNPLT
jgi:hypothetical protein